MTGLILSTSAVSAFFLFFLILSRPKKLDCQANELVIMAAHSDDCVIMGAEIAHEVFRRGGNVTVVHLTCSGPDPASEIARIRENEARAAWLKQEPEKVRFVSINLPESPVRGPASYSEHDLDVAASKVAEVLTKLSDGSMVLVPSACESHIDHFNARRCALDALKKANVKSRLLLMETTEYNSVTSMRYDPVGVLLKIIGDIPFVCRFLPERYVAPSFRSGLSQSFSTRDAAALILKKNMLKEFKSQNEQMLLKFFSWPSLYRTISNRQSIENYKDSETTDSFAKLFIAIIWIWAFSITSFIGNFGYISIAFSLLLFPIAIYAMKTRKFLFGIIVSGAFVGALSGLINS